MKRNYQMHSGVADRLIGMVLLALLVGIGGPSCAQDKASTSAGRSAEPMPEGERAGDRAGERVRTVIARMERLDLGYLEVSRVDGKVLASLVEAVDARRVVEIGTSTGYSGLWLGLGLLETGGRLTTFELDEERAATARKHFDEAGLGDRVTVVVGDAHEKVKTLNGPIDVLFLDADKKGYIDYLETLLPLVRDGGLIIAHNMHYPTPDPRYIEAVTTDPTLHTIFVNMGGPGLGITQKRSGR